MENPKNLLVRSFRFPDRTPEEIGPSPDVNDAFLLEAKWYDANGNLFKKEDYDADGNVNESDVFVFNEKNLIREHAHFMAGEQTEITVIEYNALDQPVREIKKFNEGGVQITTYEYNSSNQLIRKNMSDEEGCEEGFEIYEWKDGNLVKKGVHDLLMETGEEFIYIYIQEDGKWILKEEIQKELPGPVSYRTVYDSKGYTTYDHKGSRYAHHKKVLNEQGQIAASHYSTMQRDMSSFYKYDENGRLIEETRKVGELDNYHASFYYNENGTLERAHVTEASSGTFTDIYTSEPFDQAS